MEDESVNYSIEDYGKKPVFSSFLPGIAGVMGIPMWCFYVNRGQGVSAFGIRDKDHAIMEFYPAHQAYQQVKRTGFRTWIKSKGSLIEPFQDERKKQVMKIGMNSLYLDEVGLDLKTQVSYTTLSEEPLAGLIRHVTITNTRKEDVSMEFLDGMPFLIPYGVGIDSLKMMGETVKAWMQVEDLESSIPRYRIRASMEDTASVEEVQGMNFAMSVDQYGHQLNPIVDPDLVFSYDVSLQEPIEFLKKEIQAIYSAKQRTSNLYPCAFFGGQVKLAYMESYSFYSLVGQVSSEKVLKNFLNQEIDFDYFQKKEILAKEQIEKLTSKMMTHTGNPDFDAYCRSTYMDNILRGGYPIPLGNKKHYYIYSRKHGDLERDYNAFNIPDEYYSQGYGNYRDVCQNRRMDVFFTPEIKDEVIHQFYDLLQLDGYNPLSVEQKKYLLDPGQREEIKNTMSEALEDKSVTNGYRSFEDELEAKAIGLQKRPFTPGYLARWIHQQIMKGVIDENAGSICFDMLMDKSQPMVNGSFKEGYWTDHWTYPLDLVETYLMIYPEEEKQLLFSRPFFFYQGQARIKDRRERYTRTKDGWRQYNAIIPIKDYTEGQLKKYKDGELISVSLAEKLFLLCACKYACLDTWGMGIEMEGGKPGWYDALNGLPGIFGSSMCETYELLRHLSYLEGLFKKVEEDHIKLNLPQVCTKFIKELYDLSLTYKDKLMISIGENVEFWNAVNKAKEDYRQFIYQPINNTRAEITKKQAIQMIILWKEILNVGIHKAEAMTEEGIPSYFYYELEVQTSTYEPDKNPGHWICHPMPLFLEGAVHRMKVTKTKEALQMHESLMNGPLFDPILKMYKVNASLEKAPYTIGRAKAFTPGWLENESIWLHMEYKYLLELLKAEMYETFIEAFVHVAIPFMDPKVYGRSIYENVSFIVSSANPNVKDWGRGFVARLSGSTAEFLSMWQIMMFGKNPFILNDNQVCIEFKPTLPKALFDESLSIKSKFLGDIDISYYFEEAKDYFPGNSFIKEACLYTNKQEKINGILKNGKIMAPWAKKIRNKEVSKIEIWFQNSGKTQAVEMENQKMTPF